MYQHTIAYQGFQTISPGNFKELVTCHEYTEYTWRFDVMKFAMFSAAMTLADVKVSPRFTTWRIKGHEMKQNPMNLRINGCPIKWS